MSKVTIKGFVHACKHSGGEFMIFMSDMSSHGYPVVGPCEFEYEIPADWNPVAAEIDTLEKKLTEISDEFMQQSSRIKSRIADLKCLPAPTEAGAA